MLRRIKSEAVSVVGRLTAAGIIGLVIYHKEIWAWLKMFIKLWQ